MSNEISPRLAEIVAALPLRPGMRVLEIGCGPGVAARAVLKRIGKGRVLAIDRSAKAISQAVAGSAAELATGKLEFRCVAIENFVLAKGEREAAAPGGECLECAANHIDANPAAYLRRHVRLNAIAPRMIEDTQPVY